MFGKGEIMETFNFEKEIINNVFTHAHYIEETLPKASDDLKTLFVYLKILIDNDKYYDVVNDTDAFFSLLRLCVFGQITYANEEYDFYEIVKDEENRYIVTIYLISMALLISLEYIEMKNIYKCIKNQLENAPYVYQEISNIYHNEETDYSNLKIDIKITESICRKIPQIIDLLYSDFDLKKQ